MDIYIYIFFRQKEIISTFMGFDIELGRKKKKPQRKQHTVNEQRIAEYNI